MPSWLSGVSGLGLFRRPQTTLQRPGSPACHPHPAVAAHCTQEWNSCAGSLSSSCAVGPQPANTSMLLLLLCHLQPAFGAASTPAFGAQQSQGGLFGGSAFGVGALVVMCL